MEEEAATTINKQGRWWWWWSRGKLNYIPIRQYSSCYFLPRCSLLKVTTMNGRCNGNEGNEANERKEGYYNESSRRINKGTDDDEQVHFHQ